MNKIHRIVWNRATQRWVVASELATASGKGSRRVLAGAVALAVAAGLGGFAHAGQANSYEAGILGNDSSCLSSTAPGSVVTDATTCDSGAGGTQAALVAYDAAGQAGGYVTVSDPDTVRLGAGGVDKLLVGSGGLTAYDSLSMSNHYIRNLAAGTLDADAVNFAQLKATGQSVATALGGGAALNVDGTLSGPNYLLGNANAISGTSGTVAGVDSAFARVDTALGSLDARTALTSRYLKVVGANDGSDDASTGGFAGAMAVGRNAGAGAARAVALGDTARAIGSRSVALGYSASASGESSVALGDGAMASNGFSTAVGPWTRATGQDSTAIGSQSFSSGQQSLAIGFMAQSQGIGSFALGNMAFVDAAAGRGIAIGSGATVTGTDAVAIGRRSVADRANTVSVGSAGAERQIVNVASGSQGTDAVNVAQLKASAQSVADALGGGSVVQADGSLSAPTYVVTNVDGSTATVDNVGDAITNLDGRIYANTADIANLQQNITNLSTGTIGLVQQAAPGERLTVGKNTDGTEVSFTGTAGERKLTGVAAGTADNDAVNVSQLKATGLIDENGDAMNAVVYDSADKDSVTLGGKGAAKKVKLKNVADATQDDEAVNLGQLKATGLVDGGGNALDAVVYDAASDRGVVTFGGSGGTLLTNVRDGAIAVGSRDAVNGGQIAALRDSLQSQVTNIDNRVTSIEQARQPYFDGRGDSDISNSKDMSSASSSGVAMDEAKATGRGSVAAGANATASADGAVALGANSVADRTNTVSVGSAGAERQVVNVAAGSADTDAVNVAQLNARLAQGNSTVLSQANSYTDQRINDVWNDLGRAIDEVDRQANRGIAAASALVNVTPYVPGHTAVNAGVASYRGEAALGVGVSRWSDDGHVNFNAGMSASQGDQPIFRVGVGYVF
ncbi:ESPR-type extended signal peptide-containing protein [Lysobacter sp.]|uniref:ESPR-type extended signal peptide-containing protein n=1 Tax=Lysobacter sp. TaxID=72226 RepID=UPI002D417F30|nr:ESPR-type extended signal peptide-containing protein [Lysobacter sp.]HZX79248.1 ESPR-type extended signal peptide-containing protein [Lysobacter sp.]